MVDYVLGIDPGATGALALYCPQTTQVLALQDMPWFEKVLTTGKKSKRINAKRLAIMINDVHHKALTDNAELHVHIEDVQAFGKQSAPAAFNFGYTAGLARGICEAHELEVALIRPQRWKNQFGLKASEKDDARQLVLQMFPHLGSMLKRKMDVDRADAILISMYRRDM